MKIAVLIFGEYRTFETAVKTWNLKNYSNCDFFMSTWNKSFEKNSTSGGKNVTEDMITSKLDRVKVNISNSNDEIFKNYHYTNMMVYHWKVLHSMLLESNTEYDYVIMARPDSVFFVKNLEYFNTIKNNELFTFGGIEEFDDNLLSVNDCCFLGNFKTIDKFLSKIEPLEINDPHHDIATYIIKMELDVNPNLKDFIYYEFIRGNMVDIYSDESYDFTFNENTIPKFLTFEFTNAARKLRSKFDVGYANILIIGESCDDIFIYGDVKRLTPEAPVPIITPTKTIKSEGMARNVYNNLNSLGGNIHRFYTNDTKIKKIRYVDDSYNYILIRIDENDSVNRIDLDSLTDDVWVDYVVISDYDKGFLSTDDIEYISKKYNTITFLDTKKEFGDWIENVSYIKINHSEYERNKKYIESNPSIKEKLIITKGRLGCDFNGKNFPTQEVLIKDVAGAGDTFLAGLVFKYIQTNSIEESIEFANKCSTQVVQKRGVSVVNINELHGIK